MADDPNSGVFRSRFHAVIHHYSAYFAVKVGFNP